MLKVADAIHDSMPPRPPSMCLGVVGKTGIIIHAPSLLFIAQFQNHNIVPIPPCIDRFVGSESRDVHLVGHLGVLILGGLEVLVVFLVLILGRVLLCGLGEVDLGTTGAAALNNVVGVNLLQAILVCTRWLAWFTV
jgi:hypothetical protein